MKFGGKAGGIKCSLQKLRLEFGSPSPMCGGKKTLRVATHKCNPWAGGSRDRKILELASQQVEASNWGPDRDWDLVQKESGSYGWMPLILTLRRKWRSEGHTDPHLWPSHMHACTCTPSPHPTHTVQLFHRWNLTIVHLKATLGNSLLPISI